ncbi:MAG TPA: 2,3-bisphosphoglycerate-independent phosphoglycerate mutase [Thermomicrobiales bacterium]|nr:2,3-bisphosphoglycerate-independent phosphoglycerate mutase [Thermomicrobiales bacterium]
MTEHRTPVLLAILDGWGIAPAGAGNAISQARTPTMDRLLATMPHATLRTSGEDVGLPDGQMGNSEVGHLNIGAGFVVYQWITRLDRAIADKTFQKNAAFVTVFNRVKENGATLHLMGLIGTGGVHAHTRHLLALLDAAQEHGVTEILIHAFTDGRDTSPTSGIDFIKPIEQRLESLPGARIATVSGRYYAMDRDHRWERTKKAFDVIVHAEGPTASSAADAISSSYANDVTDEFIIPTVIADKDGKTHTLGPNDEYIFFNFRSDRGRQLTEALVVPDFSGFDRGEYDPAKHPMTTMTEYEKGLPVTVAFPPEDVTNPLAKVISDAGKTQFHTAETEKYPHVTFFLNGGREEPFPGEDRNLVPSPKVATYDLQPEMSAPEVCDGVINAIRSRKYDFVIVNFANGDMVGHTGVIPAVVKAIETVDHCLGQIIEALEEVGGTGVITADHGNAEEEIDPKTGGPMTSHTTNPVPVILVAPEGNPLRDATLRQDGILSALAPTVLDLMGLEVPVSMTQESLIERHR